MRRLILAVLVFPLLPAFAVAAPATLSTAAPATRIEADPKTGAMLFIVKGKEQARLDATGLHVRESVAHGGGDIEEGRAGYDAHAAKGSK